MTAYVVLISTHAYHVKSAHDDLVSAMRTAIDIGVKTFVCVVRDGLTGKRYSIAECQAYLQKHLPQTQHKKRRAQS